MLETRVYTKNKLGEKLDNVMDNLGQYRRRFYNDDVKDDSYVVVLTSLPGGFSTSFFEVRDKSDMYRVIYDIMGEVKGNSSKNLNRKYSVVEKMYEPSEKTTTCLLLDDYDDYPRINYGTGSQFKFSRLNRLF